MDDSDLATMHEERDRDLALKMRPRAPVIVANGACLNCGDALPPLVRWCDADCRDDWQADARRR